MHSSVTPSSSFALFTHLSTLFPPLSVTNLSSVSLSFLCFLCKNEQVYVYCPFHSLLSHVVNTRSHFAFFLLNDIPWQSLILKSLLIQMPLSTFSFFLHKLFIGETGCLSCRVSHRKVWALWVAYPWCGLTSSSVPVFSPTGNCS